MHSNGLSKTYPNGTRALNDVSFALDSGEFAVIVGKGGAGKSTLLRCMNSLTEPTGGEVEIDGRSVTGLSGNDLRAARKEMGFVFQQFNLVKRISALNNVLCGMLSGMPTMRSVLRRFTNEERVAALDCLEKVGLADKAHQRADTLSGGQQQRVAIARVLAQGPKVVLADEPVASLDPGAPNALRGLSSGGNLSALEAIEEGLVDALVSDYHPPSMIQAAFKLAREGTLPLPEAVGLVTSGPARAAGLSDRGEIREGALADLVVVGERARIPAVTHTIVGGSVRYAAG